MTHHFAWRDRPFPDELQRFLYPIRLFYNHFSDSEHREFRSGKDALCLPYNQDFEVRLVYFLFPEATSKTFQDHPLDTDWQFPDETAYWVNLGPAHPSLVRKYLDDEDFEPEATAPPASGTSISLSRRSETAPPSNVAPAGSSPAPGPAKTAAGSSHRTPSTTSGRAPAQSQPSHPAPKAPSTTSRPSVKPAPAP